MSEILKKLSDLPTSSCVVAHIPVHLDSIPGSLMGKNMDHAIISANLAAVCGQDEACYTAGNLHTLAGHRTLGLAFHHTAAMKGLGASQIEAGRIIRVDLSAFDPLVVDDLYARTVRGDGVSAQSLASMYRDSGTPKTNGRQMIFNLAALRFGDDTTKQNALKQLSPLSQNIQVEKELGIMMAKMPDGSRLPTNFIKSMAIAPN